MSPKKILLCRPRGGFNDILCQIHKCVVYAKRYDRELWVDTSRSGLRECLGNYFLDNEDFVFGVPDLSGFASVFPRGVEERIDTYRTEYDPSTKLYHEVNSNVPVTFDFTLDYSENLLVHEQSGGGDGSVQIMRKLQFLPEVSAVIDRQVASLGTYTGVHIRHSDYQTDYKKFFKIICSKFGHQHYVICTDSYECQQYALSYFRNVTKSSDIPDTSGRSLHENEDLDRSQTNMQMMVDLMTLIRGELFICTNTKCNNISGFGRLVINMRELSGATSCYIANTSNLLARCYYRFKRVAKKIVFTLVPSYKRAL